jgi:cobalt-zinc-cadmium efflux system protein
MLVATAHLVSESGADVQRILGDGQALLRDRHHIAHATLQVEPATGEQCLDTDW